MSLATLVMGIRNAKKVLEFMHIPENEIIVSVVRLDYRDVLPPMPKRKSVADITTFY